MDADCTLEHFKLELLKEQIVSNASRYLGLASCARGYWESFDCFNYEIAREIAAHETDHLVIVQSCYNFVVRRRVENFFHLLQERFPI